jgi:hypothetical protein
LKALPGFTPSFLKMMAAGQKTGERRLDQIQADENGQEMPVGRDIHTQSHRQQHHEACKGENYTIKRHFEFLLSCSTEVSGDEPERSHGSYIAYPYFIFNIFYINAAMTQVAKPKARDRMVRAAPCQPPIPVRVSDLRRICSVLNTRATI